MKHQFSQCFIRFLLLNTETYPSSFTTSQRSTHVLSTSSSNHPSPLNSSIFNSPPSFSIITDINHARRTSSSNKSSSSQSACPTSWTILTRAFSAPIASSIPPHVNEKSASA